MLLRRIQAHNYRNIAEADVTLPMGLTGILGANGTGKCLPGWVRVYDPERGESLPIEQFVRERRSSLLGLVGQQIVPVPVSEWHETGIKPLVDLKLANGSVWRTAASHPLMTPEGFVRAEQLTPGQWVATARQLPGSDEQRLSSHEATLLGLLTGDGCAKQGVVLRTRDEAAAKMFNDAIPHIFPGCRGQARGERSLNYAVVSDLTAEQKQERVVALRHKLLEHGIHLSRYLPDQRQLARFVRGAAGLDHRTIDLIEAETGLDLWQERCAFSPAAAMRSWAQEMGIWEQAADERRIRGDLLLLSQDLVELLLAGLWMTDGYISTIKANGAIEVSYTTASSGLADDVRVLLLRLGIPTSVRRRQVGSRRPFYTVIVPQGFIDRFARIPLEGVKGGRLAAAAAQRATVIANPNVDTIPPHFLHDLPAISASGKRREAHAKLRGGMSRQLFVDFGGDAAIANGDISWVKVQSVINTGLEVATYDVTVDSDEHVYVADTMLVHNSNFLESVAFCLYGHVASKTTKEDILGPAPEGCWVEVSASIKGQEYHIRREVAYGSLGTEASIRTEAELTSDTKPLVKGANEVSAYVTEQLGMDYKNFILSVFAKQGEIAALSAYQPADRMRAVLSLLGLSPVDEAIKLLRKRVTSYDRDIKARRAVLPNVAEIDAQIAQLVAELATATRNVTAAERAQASAIKSRDKAQAIYDTLSAKAQQQAELEATTNLIAQRRQTWRDEHASIEQREQDLELVAQALADLETLITQSGAHRAELDQLNAAWKQRQGLAGLRQQLEHLATTVVDLSSEERELSELVAAGPEMEREAGAVSARLAQAETELEGANAERDRLRGRLGELNERRTQLAERIELLSAPSEEEGEAKCPTCEQPLADRSQVLEHMREKLAEAELEHGQVMAAGLAARERVETLQRQLNEDRLAGANLAQRQRDSANASLRIKVVSGQLSARKREQEGIAQSIREAEAVAYDSQRHQELLDEEERLQNLLQGRAKAEGRLGERDVIAESKLRLIERDRELTTEEKANTRTLAKLAFDADAYRAAKTAAEAAREDAHTSALILTRAEGEVTRLNDALSRERKALADHDRITIEIERITRERNEHDLASETMDRFKANLVARIRPALSAKLSPLVQVLTDGRYSRAELDADYNIIVHSQGKAHLLRRFSGGEVHLVNLCLRLAISEMINEAAGTHQNFIVLDEVLGSQDANRQGNIMQLLRELSETRFAQVLLINHVDDINQTIENAVEVDFDPITETSRIMLGAS